MDESDIRYILALTRLDHLRNELKEIRHSLSVTTSRLLKAQALTKMLGTDLQIPEYGLSSSLQSAAVESLCRGREDIETSLARLYELPTPSAVTTASPSTTASLKPQDSATDWTFDREG